jgi:hypothetical protein
MASTDGDDGQNLRSAVEEMCELALAAPARRPTPLEIRATADRVYEALEEYIDRRVAKLREPVFR